MAAPSAPPAPPAPPVEASLRFHNSDHSMSPDVAVVKGDMMWDVGCVLMFVGIFFVDPQVCYIES